MLDLGTIADLRELARRTKGSEKKFGREFKQCSWKVWKDAGNVYSSNAGAGKKIKRTFVNSYTREGTGSRTGTIERKRKDPREESGAWPNIPNKSSDPPK